MAIKIRPINDAYTVLLSISLIAMIASCVLLYYDVKRYPKIVPDNIPTKNLGGGGGSGS
jgi:hypothetical protein